LNISAVLVDEGVLVFLGVLSLEVQEVLLLLLSELQLLADEQLSLVVLLLGLFAVRHHC